jgi:hypothetical protein
MSSSENQNELRSSITDLLSGNNLPDDLTKINDTTLPAKNRGQFAKIIEKSKNQAKKSIDTLLKFYLSIDIIEKEEYIKAKRELDIQSLSALIFNMEASQHAIISMLENIDNGEVHPRMFEVLGGLQKTLLDIVKAQTLFTISTEENIKKLGRDIDYYSSIKSTSDMPEAEISPETLQVRGNKDLMRSIQQLQNKNTEDETS